MKFEFKEQYETSLGSLKPGEWFSLVGSLYLVYDKTAIQQKLYLLIEPDEVIVIKLTLSSNGMEISQELLPAKTIVTVLSFIKKDKNERQ